MKAKDKSTAIKLEFQEFYPWQEGEWKPKSPNPLDKYLGTLHVYIMIGDVHLDYRGLPVWRKNDWVHIYYPTGLSFDEGKKVRYPYLNLMPPERNDELKQKIIDEGREWLWSEKKIPTHKKKRPKPQP